MNLRAKGHIDQPQTIWDDVLAQIHQSKKHFKRDCARKRNFFRVVLKLCIDVAQRWAQENNSRRLELGSDQMLGFETGIAGWARDEYLAQRLRAHDTLPEPASESEETSKPLRRKEKRKEGQD